MDFIHVWPDGRYRALSFYQHQSYPGGDLGVKVTEFL